MNRENYRDFDATELFCPRCKKAVPVRKKLLLILSSGEKYDYSCAFCGTSVGDKLVSQKDDFTIIVR